MFAAKKREVLGILVLTLLWLTACSDGSGGSGEGDSLRQDALSGDGAGGGDGAGVLDGAAPDYVSAATVTKGPYLQDPGPHSILVRWETDEYASSKVAYGSDESLSLSSSGITFQIDTSSMDELPPPERYQHEVMINDLAPGTTYHYRVVSVEEPLPEATFRTAPPAGEPFSFVVFGSTEMIHDFHALVMENIAAVQPDSLLHTGDLIAEGSDIEQWQTFFDIESPLLASTPLYPVFSDNEAKLGQIYFDGFFQLGGDSGKYYSFDYGGAHFIILDTNQPLVEGEQADWLIADLEETAAASPRFLFVSFHEPIFTFSHHPPNIEHRQFLQPLFESYNVDAVFSGHNHCYEHFLVNDIHYMVTGGGGAPLHGIFQNVVDLEDGVRLKAIKAMNFIQIRVEGTDADVTAYDVSSDEIIESFHL